MRHKTNVNLKKKEIRMKLFKLRNQSIFQTVKGCFGGMAVAATALSVANC